MCDTRQSTTSTEVIVIANTYQSKFSGSLSSSIRKSLLVRGMDGVVDTMLLTLLTSSLSSLSDRGQRREMHDWIRRQPLLLPAAKDDDDTFRNWLGPFDDDDDDDDCS